MNKKYLNILFFGFTFFALIVVFLKISKNISREPIIITGFASIEEYSLDQLISEADLIVIGKVSEIFPSLWNTSNGKLPNDVTLKNISSKYFIYTDQIFSPREVIKGIVEKEIRIRYFGGSVGVDSMTISSEVNLKTEKSYLLFLEEDKIGNTSDINPGHYVVLGSIQGLYEIVDKKAISFRDEWIFEELIAYIQKVLSEPTQTPTELIPEQTPSATIAPEIIVLETETPIPNETITPTP